MTDSTVDALSLTERERALSPRDSSFSVQVCMHLYPTELRLLREGGTGRTRQ